LRPVAAFLLAALVACRAEQPNAAATAGSPAASAVTQVEVAPSGLPLVPLEIRSGERTHRFTVEVARTGEEQARGLMYRGQLGDDEGMIFPFSPPRPASFWMKNTYIPLDMIFVRADGSIARIAPNTVPHSLESVGVAEPVAAVLEIRGGRAAELGIDATARVSWPGGPRP
jgi:uncharacterized protein